MVSYEPGDKASERNKLGIVPLPKELTSLMAATKESLNNCSTMLYLEEGSAKLLRS